MSDIYLTLADGFEKLAAGYRALAADSGSGQAVPPQAPEAELKKDPVISIEDVRVVLAEKSQKGKIHEVKALLMKYDAGKLSGVKPEDYAALLKEAEVL